MRSGMRILHGLCFVLLFGSGDFHRLRLKVTGNDSATEAIAGNDVSIPCWLSDVPTPLNLPTVSVVWTHKLPNGSERVIYQFLDSRHHSSRSGAYMNDSRLVQGDAALHLPRVQISDDGEYTCDVIVTPDDGKATSTLHVSVTPKISGSYHRSIELGFEGSVECKASGFYPEDVKMQWIRRSKHSDVLTELHDDISFTQPVRNGDGTFNRSSLLTVRPFHGTDPGDEFFCGVFQRSLEKPLIGRFTVPSVSQWMIVLSTFLILNAVLFLITSLKKLLSERWRLWKDVVSIVLYISLIVVYFYLLHCLKGFLFGLSAGLHVLSIVYIIQVFHHGIEVWYYYTIGDPLVTTIMEHKWIPHMTRTTLTCEVKHSILMEMEINVYLKRPSDRTKHKICSVSLICQSDEDTATAEHQGDDTPVAKKILKGVILDKSIQLQLRSEIKRQNKNYICRWFIHLTPDADRDNNAVLVVEVDHADLVLPVWRYHFLNVFKGDKPSLWKRIQQRISSVFDCQSEDTTF